MGYPWGKPRVREAGGEGGDRDRSPPSPGLVIPGSSVHGILQARRLEWVAIPFSRGSSPSRDHTPIS